MAKLRTRNHKVVFARSAGGDMGITVLLVLLGAFMFLPMVYVVMQSLKPLDELWMYPPRFFVMSPSLKNFGDLFSLMNISWVPFTRYIFNTVFTSVMGTFGHLFIASLAAYTMAKSKKLPSTTDEIREILSLSISILTFKEFVWSLKEKLTLYLSPRLVRSAE